MAPLKTVCLRCCLNQYFRQWFLGFKTLNLVLKLQRPSLMFSLSLTWTCIIHMDPGFLLRPGILT